MTDSSGIANPAPGVKSVPIRLLFADGEATDGEVPRERVTDAIRLGEPVKTRAVSVVDYLEAVTTTDADAAVIVTPAAELTPMWRNACNAVYLSDRPVAVVDSRTAATGQAMVVETARQRAAMGGGIADVVAAAEDAARRVRLVATVASLEPIAEAGILPSLPLERIRTRGEIAVFRLANGAVEVVRRAPGDADRAAELARIWRTHGGPESGPPWVFTTGDDSLGDRLAEMVEAARTDRPSAAMTVYTGGDVLGIAWMIRGRTRERRSR